MTAFASVGELEKFWRPMNSDETARAGFLLDVASDYLRQIANNNGVNWDEKRADTTFAQSVKMVVLASVKRAMNTPTDAPPADVWSQSANPYAESMQLTNAGGDIFFKRAELDVLGLASVSGRKTMGVVRGVRG